MSVSAMAMTVVGDRGGGEGGGKFTSPPGLYYKGLNYLATSSNLTSVLGSEDY